MSYQQDIFSLIARFSGQENMLSVPRVFCEVTGSLEAGMLLSQLLFWSDKGHDPDGWFYKSYVEWSEHLFLTEYQVRKFSKQFEEAGFLEVKLKKVNGSPTLHYRIKRGEFSEWILKNLRIETAKFQNPPLKISESNNKETETTTETTNIESDQGVNGARAATPTPPPATPKAPRLPNDGYEMPTTNGTGPSTEPTSKQLQRWVPQVEPRKFRNGYIPVGAGTTPTEVWYESFAITTAETRLTAPDQYDLRNCTDLDKLREIVTTFRQCDFKRKKNIRLILDWYRDGIPPQYQSAPATGTGFGLTAYAEKERKQYEREYGPDEQPDPEKEKRIREYFERRNQDQGV